MGATVNFRRRTKAHNEPNSIRNDVLVKNPAKGSWLQSLPQRPGELPYDRGILATFSTREGAFLAEEAWIAKLREQGEDLLNVAKGGECVMLGRTHSPETRAKLSAAGKRRFSDPAERARSVESHKLQWTEAARAKSSESQRRRFQDPAERKKASEGHVRQYQNPAARAKAAENARRNLQNPAFREKFFEGSKQYRIRRKFLQLLVARIQPPEPQPPPTHGMYRYNKWKCRCSECKAAKAAYWRTKNGGAQRPPAWGSPQHGTAAMYQAEKLKGLTPCDACRIAASSRATEYKRRAAPKP